MNEWEKCKAELAHIDLTPEKKAFNYFSWDFHVHPYLDANDKVVLDYGCGGGLFLTWLNNIYKPKAYLGVDISERSLLACKEVARECSINTFEFTKLPQLPIITPDVIICFAVIQHMTLEQLTKFMAFVEDSGAKELFIQIRHGNETTFDDESLIQRCKLSKLEFKNYKLLHESDLIPNNNYKFLHYELLRSHTSKKKKRKTRKKKLPNDWE